MFSEPASTTIDSPVGPLVAIATERGLSHLLFSDGEDAARAHRPPDDPKPFADLARQLAEYFAGDRRSFDIELDPSGTEFQLLVWQGLRTIEFGETISYAELATRIGNTKAVRAVGGANNRNPISIVIPCHRVIGKDGSLVGYGGGIDRKRTLLDLEGHRPRQLDLLACRDRALCAGL